MTSAVRALGNIVCRLGEGPVWCVGEQALYWLDIEAPAVHRWSWGASDTQTWAMPAVIGALAIRDRGGLVVALRTGIHTFDPFSGEFTFIADPEADLPGTRYNDGTVDPAGRFWIGGMVLSGDPKAAGLYRFSAAGDYTKVLSGLGCSNGMGFSPDGTVMYHTDTEAGLITRFDFDPASGEISHPADFVVDREFNPDGLTVDAQGYVWSANYDGFRVVRYSPAGTVDRVLAMPVEHCTSLAFGGPDLKTLFITTASQGLTPDDLAAQPLAGRVLVLDDPGATGQPEPLTAL